jgi:hypothetical protein
MTVAAALLTTWLLVAPDIRDLRVQPTGPVPA